MTGVEADFWVCGDCRSVNKLRSKQCYNCRTPKEIAEVDPADIEGTGRGKLREIALPEFQSSRGEAVLASVLIIGVAAMQVVTTILDAVLLGRVARNPGLLSDPAFGRSTDVLVVGTLAIATLGVALLALTAWAYWLSRVVVAMPALGLGYPAANGLMAFVENFLPGLNLFRVPAIVRDVIRRLEPGSGRGEALIFAAWIGLFGGFLIPRLGAFLGAFGSGTLEEAVQTTQLVQGVATGLVLVGAIFLVVLMWWIEQRIARRRIVQLEGEPAPSATEAGEAVAGAAAAPISADEVSEDQPLAASLAGAIPGQESSAYASAGLPTPAGVPTVPVDPGPQVTPGPPTPSASETASAPAPPIPPAAPPEPEPAGAPELPGAAPPPAWPGGSEDPVLHRPITSVAGAASIPTLSLESPRSETSPTQREEPGPGIAAASSPAEQPVAEPEPTTPAPTQDHVAAGPRLHLRVESAISMTATIDGESEAITLDELRAAAEALARADGSAVIETVGTSFGALSLAEQAFELLSDARVQTTMEE